MNNLTGITMLEIFRLNYDTEGLYQMIPQWDYIKRGIRRNREVLRNFYQMGIYHAKSEHPLVSLIYALNIPRNSPASRVYDISRARSNSLSQQIGFVSAVGKGKLFRNVFFGGGSKEIIINNISLISPDRIVEDWKNMRPVRILRHPFSDLWGNVPDGRPTIKDGLSYFSVDIPMLATMYWCFQKEQDIAEENGHARATPGQFVYAYCLANMVEDMIDHAIFNRYHSIATGTPRIEERRYHPNAFPSYSQDVDNVAPTMYQRVTQTGRRLTGRLNQAKLVFSDSVLSLSELPDLAPTLQCFWALSSCRMRMLEFGFLSMGDPRTVDPTDINLIQWSMKLQNTPLVIRNNLPIDAFVHIAPELDYVMGL